MFNRITPDMTLDRPSNPIFRRCLHVTYRPGGWFAKPPYPVKLKHGWVAEFVAHYGQEKVVVTYRKPRPVAS